MLLRFRRQSLHFEGRTWLEALREYIQGNKNFIQDCLNNALRQLRIISIDATYLLWLYCSMILFADKAWVF